MNQNERHQSIRAYLLERMPAADREAFEAAMAADPVLAQDVALQVGEIEIGEMLLEEQARGWIAAHRRQRTAWGLFWSKKQVVVTLLAATIALVLAAVWWFRTPETARDTPPVIAHQTPPPVTTAPNGDTAPTAPVRPPSDRYLALARENFQEPPLHTLRTPAPANAASFYRQAEQAYGRGEYQRTLDLLARTDSTQQQLAAFLKAHALFHLGRFQAAAGQFSFLVDSNSRQFRYDSEWGLALCRLAEKTTRQKALDLLQYMAGQPDHPYAERAQALLKTLSRTARE